MCRSPAKIRDVCHFTHCIRLPLQKSCQSYVAPWLVLFCALKRQCICEILTLSPSCPCWVNSGLPKPILAYLSPSATSGGCCAFLGLPQAMLDPKGCFGACLSQFLAMGFTSGFKEKYKLSLTQACNMSKHVQTMRSIVVCHKKRI